MGWKISFIVFLTLIIVAGPFLVIEFYNARKDVYALNEKRWDLLTEAVYKAIETVMLEGKADIANNIVNDFRQIREVEALEVVSMDGTRAFDEKRPKVLETEMIDRLIKGQRLNIYEESGGKRVLIHFGLLHNTERCQRCHGKDSPYRAAVMIKTSLATTEAKVFSIMARIISMGSLVIAGLLVVIPLSIRRKVVKPIEAVLSVTAEISKGDLTRVVTTSSKDEMGKLVSAIEAMRKGLVGLIHQVRDSLKKVKLSVSGFVTGMNKLTEGSEKQVVDSAEITTSALEINTTTGEITEAVKHLHESAEGTLTTLLEMKASVKEIAENTASFASFIDETSSPIEESFASIKAINESIEYSRKSVSSTLESATQITASVNEVRDSAKQSSHLAKEVTSTIREKGITSIHESVKSISEIKDSADDTAAIVKGMRKSSEKIDEIVQVITEVADETKLLALNAAILSAQAGEHGKGFGVVADEIGRLAERTAQNTKEITTIIEEVKGYINNVATAEEKTVNLIEQGLELITDAGVVFNGVLETSTASAFQTAFIEKATAEQAKAIQEITSSIEGISFRMEEILNASEQQRSGSEMILSGIEKSKEIAQGLKNSTSEQSKGADLITRSGEDILSQVTRVKKAMEDMKAGSVAITKRIEAITDIAKDNLGLAKEMTKESSLLGDAVGTLDGEINRFRS
ncbi:MAG: methyl-accepting chemotaxis protein [Nitrospirae bacterium]|nr:methyl-accepting chemotaxis protein [Nitrospirota bacterium]